MKAYLLLLLVTAAVPAYPQARFEVASGRSSPPGATVRDARINFRGDRFEAKAETVGDILDMLREFQLYRVIGGPSWMRTDRYDIEAKADRALDSADPEPAVMALLAERFNLATHLEKREVSSLAVPAPRALAELKPGVQDEALRST
jgi:uncharacterized protein (TIGR03435 family)